MAIPDPLIRTKLHRPLIREYLVPRQRLHSQILQGLMGPLLLIVAPAGFGKTTLAASAILSAGMASAWLSLDKDDNQPGHFLDYLVAAVQTADSTLGRDTARLLNPDRQASPQAVLTTLVNELDTSGKDLILVLDDYQFIHSSAVHEQVSFLLEHRPPTFHLMIVSRSDPPLPFARLRARGQVVELRAADLRFTELEASQFLNNVMGLRLDEKAVAQLEERTEGWIAGLQMAALSMRDRHDIVGFIESFSGTNRYILDYLLEEVLSNQSPEIERFLLCTSVLERFTAPLCDALLLGEGEKPPAASVLEYLERANLFLVPLDEERRWYRYHHLFSDLLRARLVHSPYGQDQKSLHARAANWYEGNGYLEDAVHHALAAEDYLAAARNIESSCENAWLNGQYARMQTWIRALPESLVHSRPWLCLWNAWVYTQLGPPEQLRQWIDASERAITPESDNSQFLSNEIAALKVFSVSFSRDYQQAIALAEDVLQRPPLKHLMASQFIRCNILHLLSSMYFATGQILKAEQTCLETIALAKQIGFMLRYLHCSNKLMLVYRVTGRLVLANQKLEETQSYLREQGYSDYFAAWQLHFRKIELLYEWNRLDELQALLDLSLKHERAIEMIYLQVDLQNIKAQILLSHGEYGAAQNALDQAFALARPTYIWEGLAWRTEWLQMRLWLLKGDIAQATEWAFGGSEEIPDIIPFSKEVRMIARAHILLVQDDCEAAINLLERLSRSAELDARKGSLIEILSLKALTFQRAGNTDQAFGAMEKALALAEPEGYTRTFIDQGEPMRLLIRQWVSQAGTNSLREYSSRLLSQFDADKPESPAEQQKPSGQTGLIEPLTARELDVLRLVTAGLSNRQIGEQLFLAEGTVKFYMHAIMAKLGVHSRTAAIAMAREQKLL